MRNNKSNLLLNAKYQPNTHTHTHTLASAHTYNNLICYERISGTCSICAPVLSSVVRSFVRLVRPSMLLSNCDNLSYRTTHTYICDTPQHTPNQITHRVRSVRTSVARVTKLRERNENSHPFAHEMPSHPGGLHDHLVSCARARTRYDKS